MKMVSNNNMTFEDFTMYETGRQNATYLNGTSFTETAVPKISTYVYVWVTVVNVIIFLLGVFGNIMVIIVIIKVREMRTSMNFFLLNLSCADLLVLLICQPSGQLEFYAEERWYLGEVMCKLVSQLENAVVHASVSTILAITIERYNAICYPLKKKSQVCERKTTAKFILVIWIIAYVSTIPFMIMTNEQDSVFHDGTPCKVCRTELSMKWHHVYSLSIFVIFYVVTLFILIVMYSRIINCLIRDANSILTRSDSRSINTLRKRKQVVRMLIGIVALFFVSLFPIRIVTIWLIYTPTSDIATLGIDGYFNLLSVVRAMMYINSAGNPVIYSLTSTKFKHAFAKVLGRNRNRFRRRFYRNNYNQKSTEMVRFTSKSLTDNNKGNDQQQHARLCIEISFHAV